MLNVFNRDIELDPTSHTTFEERNNKMSTFQIANRVFNATVDKFTKQDYSKCSFLKSWYLHNIYCKSQQALLGIQPIKPSVILCGDEFMFTPPFKQPNLAENGLVTLEDVSSLFQPSIYNHNTMDKKYSLQEEENILASNLFYAEEQQQPSQEIVVLDNDPFDLFTDEFYNMITTEIDEYPITTHFSSSSSNSSSDSDSDSDSYCNEEISFVDEEDSLFQIDPPQQDVNMASQQLPVTRSSSFLSQTSVVSYQSLADIMGDTDQSSLSNTCLLARFIVYVSNCWHNLVSFLFKNAETEQLLPK
ncbi:hypothetical protein G6F47_002963 [Rhizopus delemar]|uniref:Uncharacterized protein n=1 Tax=Rhizopus delemar (strain RA 99-880 / ATCC MYA-4621 / FGSC 9543 / NRRL 43880) TaxID=246409 RepID=I1BII4_RHIO9|nr:hypothetical protein RO3G_00718 [Rhizopus delemar RA 99-880]KAG1497390.1 hypothetical protein G6F53_011980 [Rhizopus delemar]KAG1503296.1 hypothetical protein G6F54_001765 [Rhizopus delemar]KAG1602232.1 hypothetical protein G6F47_002963 [Rhizopus delemar]KAG1643290.1 hypothetical protein G6F44_003973 [Rhizopus delemar]|eukprot:EIE76014.1 hypothetical protein RO3G_00718 [Rhizopus delemar RA 99-880]